MSELIHTASALPLPAPRAPIHIRAAVLDDLAFIDALQKKHTKMVGWMPTKTLEGKIALGHVIIAESKGEPVGYCIGNDRYFKRDDVGVIYQMNVLPDRQRGFIGASLLKAMFDRAAYGCKLFCCWCAQDIQANRFWESMGFVPLAFRAGSEAKGRIHIFWQKRIRAGDVTTPWWFPSKTDQGALRADRIVLPIPPGVHWSEVKPVVMTQTVEIEKRIETSGNPVAHRSSPSAESARRSTESPTLRQPTRPRMQFGPPPAVPQSAPEIATVGKKVKPTKQKKPKAKLDPKFIEAARELRDRYLEQVNDGGHQLATAGKYDLVREIKQKRIESTPLLIAA